MGVDKNIRKISKGEEREGRKVNLHTKSILRSLK